MIDGDDSDIGEDGEIWEEEGGFLVISADKVSGSRDTINNNPNFFEKYLSFDGQKKIKAWSQFSRCLNFFFKNNFLLLYLIVPFFSPYGSIIICSSVYCCHLLEMNIFVVQGGSEIISRVDVAVSTTSRFQRNTNTKHKKNTNTKHKAQDTNTKHKAQSRFQQ